MTELRQISVSTGRYHNTRHYICPNSTPPMELYRRSTDPSASFKRQKISLCADHKNAFLTPITTITGIDVNDALMVGGSNHRDTLVRVKDLVMNGPSRLQLNFLASKINDQRPNHPSELEVGLSSTRSATPRVYLRDNFNNPRDASLPHNTEYTRVTLYALYYIPVLKARRTLYTTPGGVLATMTGSSCAFIFRNERSRERAWSSRNLI